MDGEPLIASRPTYDIVEEYVKSLDEYRSLKSPSDEAISDIILGMEYNYPLLTTSFLSLDLTFVTMFPLFFTHSLPGTSSSYIQPG